MYTKTTLKNKKQNLHKFNITSDMVLLFEVRFKNLRIFTNQQKSYYLTIARYFIYKTK